MAAVSSPAAPQILVGGSTRNGDFNANPGAAIDFAGTTNWYNLAGGQDEECTKSNLDYDGSQNAVLTAGKTFAVDTGHAISEGGIYDISYVWRDAWNWVDNTDEIAVSLFVTSDNTLTGTRSNLVTDASGTSTADSTYEAVDHDSIYTAVASVTGKTLFVAIETSSPGFGRLDDFELTLRPLGSAAYSVIYDGNGDRSGTVPVDTNVYAFGATATVHGNRGVLAKPFYAFSGWNTASNGTGTAYAPNDTVPIPASNVVLYAQWTHEGGGPITLYAQPSLQGTGTIVPDTHTIYSGAGIPGGLDDGISSFRLEDGYMAVVADAPDGTGTSKVYIASDGTLSVNALPAALDHAISFLRVMPWKETTKKGTGGDLSASPTVDPGWYYIWGNSVAKGQARESREYAPMSWGAGGTDPDDIANYRAMDQVTHLLGFNEPDYPDSQSGQWNNLYMVSTAVVFYAELQKAGLRLVSPAPHEENAGDPGDWLTQFIDQASTATVRVDVAALHWYDWASNPEVNTNPAPAAVFARFKEYLSNAYARYRRPLWITEFNANPNRPRAVQDGFLELALPYLERCGYVERYAWFQPFGGNGDFFSGDQLTSTGQLYKDQVSTPAYVSGVLPTPWQTSDVGTVAQTGDVIHANGTYTVCGTGAGIAGTADAFRFVYQRLSGDVTAIAKVNTMVERSAESVAGVMVREDLTAGSRHALMSITAGSGARFSRRSTISGSTGSTACPGIATPCWVKVTRVGDTLTGHYSTNGAAWVEAGSHDIPMSSDVYIGLAVCSSSDGLFNDAVLTDVLAFEHGVTASNAVPYVWLVDQNRDWANDYEAAATNDHDGDGYPTWQEYWSGTNPREADSHLRISDVSIVGGDTRLEWSADQVDSNIPPICIQSRTNLTTGEWEYAGEQRPVDGTNMWEGFLPGHIYFRLCVTNVPQE